MGPGRLQCHTTHKTHRAVGVPGRALAGGMPLGPRVLRGGWQYPRVPEGVPLSPKGGGTSLPGDNVGGDDFGRGQFRHLPGVLSFPGGLWMVSPKAAARHGTAQWRSHAPYMGTSLDMGPQDQARKLLRRTPPGISPLVLTATFAP